VLVGTAIVFVGLGSVEASGAAASVGAARVAGAADVFRLAANV
jgi:hypothetical protein